MLPALKNATRLSFGHDAGRHPDRRVRFTSQGERGRLVHVDRLWGVDYRDVQPSRIAMSPQLVLQLLTGSDQNHSHIQVPGRHQRALDNVAWREVSAGRIDRDAGRADPYLTRLTAGHR